MNMLKFILSDKVAIKFNWAGRDNKKRAFKTTSIAKVIQGNFLLFYKVLSIIVLIYFRYIYITAFFKFNHCIHIFIQIVKGHMKKILNLSFVSDATMTAFSKHGIDRADLTDKCIQDAMKDWLKLAKHRLDNKAKKIRLN